MKPARTEFRLLIPWMLLVIVATSGAFVSANAASITATEDAAKFGHLDQAATSCKLSGCGATSAVNSFVYLQNMFPNVFSTPLVPKAGDTLTQEDMVAVADELSRRMGTGPNGTNIEDFILGKMSYLEEKNKGRTKYSAQLALAWDSIAVKPDFVKDQTPPTLSFIASEIKAGEDVEAFLAGPDGRHFITLTGISYDDIANTGTLSFVDPLGGKDTTVNITGVDANKLIHVQYKFGQETGDFVIGNVVTESPVPEPSVAVLLTLGMAALVTIRRKKGTGDGSPA